MICTIFLLYQCYYYSMKEQHEKQNRIITLMSSLNTGIVLNFNNLHIKPNPLLLESINAKFHTNIENYHFREVQNRSITIEEI